MSRVYVFAGVLIVIAVAASFLLLYVKVAQKMFSKSKKKRVDK